MRQPARFSIALQALQIGAHVGCVLVAKIAVLLQRFENDALQVWPADRGLRRTGGGGTQLRMDSKMTPELSPRKGMAPVAISYSTAPNEKRSVRESNSLARTCSGDI